MIDVSANMVVVIISQYIFVSYHLKLIQRYMQITSQLSWGENSPEEWDTEEIHNVMK